MANVCLAHVVIDLTPFVWMDVSRRVFSVSHELFEKWIDVASDDLAV